MAKAAHPCTQTHDTATAMDTESEMKDLSDEMRAEAGLPPKAAAATGAAADGEAKKDVEMVSECCRRHPDHGNQSYFLH